MNSPVAEGSKAALLQVQWGDRYRGYSDSRTLLDPCEPQNFVYEGYRRSYRWQVNLPIGFRDDFPKEDELGYDNASTIKRRGGGYNIEWHHGGDGSAPVYLGTGQNYFTLLVNHDPGSTATSEHYQLIPMFTGRWIDWVAEMYFSATSAGWIDIYADSGSGLALIHTTSCSAHTYCGPNLYSNPSWFSTWGQDQRHYWEIGLYRNGYIGDPNLRYRPCGSSYPSNRYDCTGPLVYPDSPTPTNAYFDGFSFGPTFSSVYNAPLGGGTPSNPQISTLSDPFSGSSIDSSKWAAPVQTQGTVTEGGGFLHLTPNAGTASAQVYLQSNGLYSLLGSAAFVKVPQVVSSGGAVDNNFALVQDPSNALAWWYNNATLSATRTTAGVKTTVVSLPYSPANHAWWRIREASGTVFWETSPDGQAWTTQGTTATSNVSYVSGVRPIFYAETLASSPSPGEARYSNFNVGSSPPPGIAFRAASTYTVTSANTLSIDLVVPAAVQANDVLIANVYAGDYLGTALPAISPPAGWTLVKQVADGTQGILQIYSKVASASDAGTTASWTTNIWVGSASSLLAYSGVSSVTPVDQSAVQDNPTISSSYSTPSVSTTAANDTLIATYASYSDYTPPLITWSTPSGTTQRVNVNNNALLAISNDDATQASAGASGSFTSTSTPQQTYALTALVALKAGP